MIVRQSRIYRADLRANPGVLYVFGDNVTRRGLGGQAAEMRDEPNAVGVATKWSPGNHTLDYFDDFQFEKIANIIDADLERVRVHLDAGYVVVVPLDGIGTGLSELPERAPRVYEYIQALGLAPAQEKIAPHPCPYKVEIMYDSDTLCTCDANAEGVCRMEV